MAGPNFISQVISGWGRFPVEPCQVFRPERRAELAAILASGAQGNYLPRGLGRSYGDAALNAQGGVISLTRLNRFLGFDPSGGILECEAGVSFAEILRHFLPRGFFPPVTPGTKFVTLGGAIAADVHGKNHHRDGTLANFILDFKLLTPSGEVRVCSRDTNPQIFWTTLGGMGLTGIVLSARVNLRKVESAYVLVDYERAQNLQEALDAMEESDERYAYSVAWIDCLARGKSTGRAVLMRGNHAARAQLPKRVKNPLAEPPRLRWSLPFDLPSFALNSLSVKAFNAFYYASHRNAVGQLVDFESFFYPLDAIENWNRLYGKRGFVQYQVAIPQESSRRGLAAVLERLSQSRRASFLAVLKRFGDANPGPLSFPFRGCTLALDLPVTNGLVPFLREMDRVVIGYGGRVYLAKDALLKAEDFAAMYPGAERFRAVKSQLDPKGLLSSSLGRRLGLV